MGCLLPEQAALGAINTPMLSYDEWVAHLRLHGIDQFRRRLLWQWSGGRFWVTVGFAQSIILILLYRSAWKRTCTALPRTSTSSPVVTSSVDRWDAASPEESATNTPRTSEIGSSGSAGGRRRALEAEWWWYQLKHDVNRVSMQTRRHVGFLCCRHVDKRLGRSSFGSLL